MSYANDTSWTSKIGSAFNCVPPRTLQSPDDGAECDCHPKNQPHPIPCLHLEGPQSDDRAAKPSRLHGQVDVAAQVERLSEQGPRDRSHHSPVLRRGSWP